MLVVLTSKIFTNKDAVFVFFSRIFTISGRIIKILQECAVRACPAVEKPKKMKVSRSPEITQTFLQK